MESRWEVAFGRREGRRSKKGKSIITGMPERRWELKIYPLKFLRCSKMAIIKRRKNNIINFKTLNLILIIYLIRFIGLTEYIKLFDD